MPDSRRERWVIALLVYTMLAWGANVVVMKVMTASFAVAHLSAIRMTAAFVCIAAIARVLRRRLRRPTLAQWGWLAAAAALMIYLHQLLLTQGLAWSSATNGALALGLNPLLSVLLGALLFGERLDAVRAGGVLLGCAGAAIVVLNRSGATLHASGVGDVLLIASMVVYVLAGACIRHISGELHPMEIGYYMHALGAVMLVVHATFTPSFWTADAWFPGITPWVLVAFSALCSTALGSLAWNYGISRLGLGRTSMFINLMPVSALAFAVVFLGEVLRIEHAVGFTLLLAGTWLCVSRRRLAVATVS